MADKVKGIELQIGGNTVGLNKALGSVNKEVNATQKELREVERLLKLDPKNTELLAQKQQLLGNNINTVKEKLSALKNAQKQVDEDMKNGVEVNQTQYRKLQREIVVTEQKLKTLTKETSKFTQVGEKLKGTGGKITDIGKKGMAITAAVTAAAAASVKMASDYEESLNKVDVAFGENADEVKKWADTSLKNYGLAKGTALETTSLYGDMGTAMGLSTAEASKMSISLTGLSADLASFKNVSQEVAQNALKGIFTGEGESLKSLGIIMQDTTLKEYALAKGYEKKYADMTQAEKVQLRYNYVMENTKNAQGDFARTSDGTANSVRMLQEAVKELAAKIGEKLIPVVTPIIQKITEWVQWFSTLDGSVQTIIMVIAGLAAVIPPILIIIGSVITAIGTITTAMSGLNLAFLACPITWIIAAIVGLVATFVILWNKCDAFRNFWITCWEGIKNIADTVVNALTTFFTEIVPDALKATSDFLSNAFTTDWSSSFGIIGDSVNAFFQNFSNIFNSVKDVFNGVVDFIKNIFAGDWKGAWEALVNIFKAQFELLVSIAKVPLNGIIGLVNGVITALNGMIRGLNKIKIDAPEWVTKLTGITRFGVNIPNIPKVPMLANGGVLSRGTAIVGEKGPETVTVENGKAIVEPLSGISGSSRIGHTINQYFYTQTATPSQVYNASRKAMNDASVAVAF